MPELQDHASKPGRNGLRGVSANPVVGRALLASLSAVGLPEHSCSTRLNDQGAGSLPSLSELRHSLASLSATFTNQPGGWVIEKVSARVWRKGNTCSVGATHMGHGHARSSSKVGTDDQVGQSDLRKSLIGHIINTTNDCSYEVAQAYQAAGRGVMRQPAHPHRGFCVLPSPSLAGRQEPHP